MIKHSYPVRAQLWLYPGKAAWHFITVPSDISEDISFHYAHLKRGWGSLRVQVTVGKTVWTTSIFPDKKSGSYLLPVKSSVRQAIQVLAGQTIDLTIDVLDN